MLCIKMLWEQEDGAIVSAEIMLIATILVIGVIVGLKSVRDAVVTELADVGQAFSNLDQSYSYSGTQGHHAFTGGGFFHDKADFCDGRDSGGHVQNSKCVEICCSLLHPLCGGNADGAGGNTGGGW